MNLMQSILLTNPAIKPKAAKHSALQRMKEARMEDTIKLETPMTRIPEFREPPIKNRGKHFGEKVKVVDDKDNIYTVLLDELYEGRDLMPGEVIYQASIITPSYKHGHKVYVVEKQNGEIFGYIDPFVGRKFEFGGLVKKMNEKVSFKDLFKK